MEIQKVSRWGSLSAFVIVVLCCGVFVFFGTAFASGHFDWTATGRRDGFSSRTYTTPRGGVHKIKATTDCQGRPGTYTIRLIHERGVPLPDQNLGTQTYSCHHQTKRSWDTDHKDNFHFTFDGHTPTNGGWPGANSHGRTKYPS